jgi:hypothetical protein
MGEIGLPIGRQGIGRDPVMRRHRHGAAANGQHRHDESAEEPLRRLIEGDRQQENQKQE